MKIVLLTFIFSLMAGLASAQISFDQETVKQHCKEEWQSDYEMQNYCNEKMRDGFQLFGRKLNKAMADEEILIGPFQNCIQEWFPQWDMVDYCADQHIDGFITYFEAVKKIDSAIASQIQEHCRREWGADWNMTGYCVNRQVEAFHIQN